MTGIQADMAAGEQRVREIEAVLSRLPLRDDLPRSDLLGRRQQISRILATLYHRDFDDEISARLLTNHAGAKKEITTLVKLGRALQEHLRAMHFNTWAALEASPNRVSLLELLQPLEWTVANAPLATLDGIPASVGRPKKNKCRHIAEALAWEYRALTGAPPGRINRERAAYPGGQQEGGQFTEIVQDIFDLLGLDGKAQSYTAEAIASTAGESPPELWPLNNRP